MYWTDEGVVLECRAFGERDTVATLFTRAHGRVLGLARGGQGRRAVPMLQPGNRLAARWRARMVDHLGQFTLEPLSFHAARLIDDGPRLDALSAVTALLTTSLADHDPHQRLYDGLLVLFDCLIEDGPWPQLFVRFEVELLAELGFGLSLDSCSVTATREDLTHVSPRTGRAVCRVAAAPYAERLFRLPPFLGGAPGNRGEVRDIADGFALTGHFLERHVLAPRGRSLPAALGRLVARFEV